MNRRRKQNELYWEQKKLRDLSMCKGDYEQQQEMRKEQDKLYKKFIFYQNLNEAVEKKAIRNKLELGRKCKEIRQEGRYSVTKWADKLGLKRQQIIEFEKGITAIPTLVLVEYSNLKKQNENRKKRKQKNE